MDNQEDSKVVNNQVESSGDVGNSETPKDKYSYYYKNFIVYGLVIITGFGAAYSSMNLLTTFAGKSLGFAALSIVAFAGLFIVFTISAGTRSIGTRKSLVLSYLFLLLFVAGQFYVSPYTIIPAAVFLGLGYSYFWACSGMYLSKLAMDYASQCNMNHEKMISFANGYLMACYSVAILLGNALSSSILLPSDLDEQSVAVGNESCNLRQSTDHIDPYNVHLMTLRGVLLLGSSIAFITVLFFVNDIKGESLIFNMKSFILELKRSNTDFLKTLTKDKPYIILGLPIVITGSVVQGYTLGSFPKDYISECVGVHIVGYATMVYGLTSAVSSFLTGKIYLAYLPRYLVAIVNCLTTLGLLTFLLLWEREPSYIFIFVFISLWGIVDGQNNTLLASYIGYMLHEQLDIAYTIYSLCMCSGHLIVFASGFIFNTQGVQCVMAVIVSASLPPYLLAEWLHRRQCLKASANSMKTETIAEKTESTSKPDYIYLFIHHDKRASFCYYETGI